MVPRSNMTDEVTVITRQQGPAIIHERIDSKGTLDDLFKIVQNPGSEKRLYATDKDIPLRDRKLPKSFFTPVKEFDGIGSSNPPQPLHVRSRSSPASINQTLSLAPEVSPYPQQQTAQQSSGTASHYRQKSVPPPQTAGQQQQLYNTVVINQQYKLGYLLDGRIVFQNKMTNDVYADNPAVRDQILGRLPDQWTSHAERGEVYYVDHSTRTTTWFDPRLQREIQEPFIHSRHQQNQNLQNQLQQQQQLNVANRSLSPPQRQPVAAASMGQVQQQSMMHQLQQQQQAAFLPAQRYPTNASALPSAVMSPAHQQPQIPLTLQLPQQQQTRLHELEMERENMRLRQKEIQKQQSFNPQTPFTDQRSQMTQASGMQEQMMRRQMGDDYMMGSPSSPLANLRTNDPFMYNHGRQESGDSGVSASSTPHTPENFLTQNMEELSLYTHPTCGSADLWQQQQQQQQQGVGSAMGMTVGTGHNNSMQPVSSHQDDQIMSDGQDDLSDIYFSDLESVLRNDKADPYANVTWL